MRRSAALPAAAGAAGGVLVTKRSLDARVARWDSNPDHCDGDPLGLMPPAGNEAIADLIPGARIEVLPGMGHMLMFEAPDAVTDAIVQATKPADAAPHASR
jgi:pimeloyl-ACP methyl ester carboxylesterase